MCLLSIPARLPAVAAVSFFPPDAVMLLLLPELIPLAPATSLTAATALPDGAAGEREAAETAALQARRGSMCVFKVAGRKRNKGARRRQSGAKTPKRVPSSSFGSETAESRKEALTPLIAGVQVRDGLTETRFCYTSDCDCMLHTQKRVT